MRRQESPELPVTVAVTNYDGADVLPDTMQALAEFRSSFRELVLVDDGSRDGSPEWVADRYGWVRIVRLGVNTGNLNRVRNRALAEASSPFVFLMDNDIVVRPGTIERLLRECERRADVLCCTPRLVYRSDPSRLYHDGGGLHYLCVSRAVPRGEAVAGRRPTSPRPTIGGGIMLIDRERALEIGGFDDGYRRGWGDDGEFHLRGRLQGLQVLHVSDATCEHVDRPHGRDRILAQLYNRYRMLVTAYSKRSLLLLAPPLLAFEVALTIGAMAGGFVRLRFRALTEALSQLPELARRREEIQARRVRADAAIFEAGALSVPSATKRWTESSRVAGAIARLSDAYWHAVSRWL